MEHVLVMNEVVKAFGDHVAVDRVSARIPRGCIYGFLGPNGAGKTTTLRMVMGILYPDKGRLEVLGRTNPESVKERLGYLPEERGIYKKMKVLDLVAYLGRLKGLDRRTARTRAQDLLERWDLGKWANKKCDSLSKGMGQKVQILATLIHEPEMIILDEPFSGLDPVNTELVRELVLDLKREGKTVLFSTHVMEQAEQMCDAILLINKGTKILDGPLSEVKGGRGRSILIDYDGDGNHFRRLSGVVKMNDMGKSVELLLADDADPQTMLAELVGKVTIRRFDTREQSLHQIFIQAVRGDDHA